jgi:hypothetical protein
LQEKQRNIVDAVVWANGNPTAGVLHFIAINIGCYTAPEAVERAVLEALVPGVPRRNVRQLPVFLFVPSLPKSTLTSPAFVFDEHGRSGSHWIRKKFVLVIYPHRPTKSQLRIGIRRLSCRSVDGTPIPWCDVASIYAPGEALQGAFMAQEAT